MKFLRIVGDVDKNNKQISANLKEPINIKKGSKVALHSLSMELAEEDAVTELYETTSNTNTFVADTHTVTLDVATYTFPEFQTQIRTKYAHQAGGDIGGYHLLLNYANARLGFVRSYFPGQAADFANEWVVFSGAPTLSGSDFDANGSTDDVAVLSDYPIPNASSEFSGEITAVGDFRITGTFFTDDLYYMGINTSGNWYYADGAGGVTVGPAANMGDKFRMTRLKGTVTYRVNGITIGTSGFTEANQVSVNSNTDQYVWLISADAGSVAAFTDARCNVMDTVDGSATSESITFGSIRLARQLGFKHSGVAYEDSGAPAVVVGLSEPLGAATEGGVLVCLDPFILESYDADTRVSGRGRNNIIYAITKRDSDTEVDVNTNYPIALDIKNASDTIITNINVSFRNASNGNPLAFQNNPVLVLLFYGPDER